MCVFCGRCKTYIRETVADGSSPRVRGMPGGDRCSRNEREEAAGEGRGTGRRDAAGVSGRGESLPVGTRYLLRVIELEQPPCLELRHTRLALHTRPGAERAKRQQIMEDWYRDQVKRLAAVVDRRMGTSDRRSCEHILCTTHEDTMGNLQSRGGNDSAQHRPRQEARVHASIISWYTNRCISWNPPVTNDVSL